MAGDRALLAAAGISKRYGATQALRGVDFDLRAGEIHALLGENGAGKSTLVRVLSGTEPFDEGELRIDGEAVASYDAAGAIARGLFVVHQELSLVEELSIAENIFLNRVPLRSVGPIALVDRGAMKRRAAESLRVMEFHADVNTKVRTLDQAGRQVVEICRALAGAVRILLLDEPTSSLAPDDRERLYRRMRAVASSGVAIVLITHNLEEALKVADRITVLRDGAKVGTIDRAAARVEGVIEMMTGLAAGEVFPARDGADRRGVRLAVSGLASPPRVNGASFEVREGEIVGLAGLVGSGRTELMKTLYGLLPRTAGTVLLDGRPVAIGDPVSAMRAGLFMISEDRQGEGIIPTDSILSNMAISNIVTRGDEDGTAPRGVLRWSRIRQICEGLREAIQIKASSLDASILSLSGGNQQKVVLGRCLMNRPRIILADEPTRGVSIGSKVEIYKVLRDLAAEGVSILIASSEFDELVGLCNRIYLIDQGRLSQPVDNVRLTSEKLLNLVLSASSAAARAS